MSLGICDLDNTWLRKLFGEKWYPKRPEAINPFVEASKKKTNDAESKEVIPGKSYYAPGGIRPDESIDDYKNRAIILSGSRDLT